MSGGLSYAILILGTTVAAPSPPEASTAHAGHAFEFRPGVLVDPATGIAYLMNTREGVDALDLRSGKPLWTTSLAQKPLLLVGNTLIAQAESRNRGDVLPLVLLDRGNGASRGGIEIVLPRGIRAQIDDSPGFAFSARAWPAVGGPIVAWSYEQRPIRAVRDPQAPESEEHRVEGAAQIDLETGRITVVPSGKVPRPPASALPSALAKVIESGHLSSPIWHSGDVYAATTRVRRDAGEQTVLNRWRAPSGEPLPEVTLFREPYTIRYASADGRHLLASRPHGMPSASFEGYDWVIFSLATGERIAELRLRSPAAWFFLNGPLLVCEVQPEARLVDGTWVGEPRELYALDSRSGAKRWAWPLRDTSNRGPSPPRGPP